MNSKTICTATCFVGLLVAAYGLWILGSSEVVPYCWWGYKWWYGGELVYGLSMFFWNVLIPVAALLYSCIAVAAIWGLARFICDWLRRTKAEGRS